MVWGPQKGHKITKYKEIWNTFVWSCLQSSFLVKYQKLFSKRNNFIEGRITHFCPKQPTFFSRSKSVLTRGGWDWITNTLIISPLTKLNYNHPLFGWTIQPVTTRGLKSTDAVHFKTTMFMSWKSQALVTPGTCTSPNTRMYEYHMYCSLHIFSPGQCWVFLPLMIETDEEWQETGRREGDDMQQRAWAVRP